MYGLKGEHGGNIPHEPANRVAFSGAPGKKVQRKRPRHSRGGVVLHTKQQQKNRLKGHREMNCIKPKWKICSSKTTPSDQN